MRGDSIEANAELIAQNALRMADGDTAKALAIVAEFASWCHAHKSSGVDYEGGPVMGNWKPRDIIPAIVLPNE
jgi:hypothetical protein